jgi:adenylate cyclase class IV
MEERVELIHKELANEPINVPGNPFWNVFKRFGRDEAIAMIINVLGTAGLAFVTTNIFLLSMIGPIIEKIGFFPAHIKEALEVYNTTPEKRRKSRLFYVKKAFKNGSKSLLEDILVHDPIYIILLLVGLKLYPATPVWMLSAFSFVVAVIMVSGLEVSFTEWQYLRFKNKLKKCGFGFENYYESRFLISTIKNPNKVIKDLAKEFNLSDIRTMHYQDIYYSNKLPEFSGRTAKVRLRRRTDTPKSWMQTAQITYTRATEISKRKPDQCRYFPIRKEKMYAFMKYKMPKSIGQIKNSAVRSLLKKACDTEQPQKVNFVRTVAYNEELLISTDKVHGNNPFYLLEIKTYKDTNLLKEAMRYVMRELPVVQTTHGKSDFTCD